LNDVFQRGLSILDECTCNSEDGCPRCTYSYRCGNNNEYLHREGAKEVFKKILDGELSELDLNIKPELRPLV
jgi:DEAD/DEAH box helicase domain-containing protein